jgi:murein DD-endopeptidase MepM/ murein hydrolase activator NlpD
MTFPIKGEYRLTQSFGEKKMVYSNPAKAHNGYDYAASRGTTLVAPEDAKVVIAKEYPSDSTGYGNHITLLIPRGGNRYSLDRYGHLLKLFVTEGQEVKEGDTIGFIDSTGYSTGDHLHWDRKEVEKTTWSDPRPKTYYDFPLAILDYRNGYYGAYAFLDEPPIELLPVDLRYGQTYDEDREDDWKRVHENYAKKQALKYGIPYDDRLMKAFIYGFWDSKNVFDPAMYTVYTTMHKPEYLKRLGKL